jgi:hypothetical protein
VIRVSLFAALAACGDNAAPPTPAVPCSATFSGNFAETSTSDQCAMIGTMSLELTVPSSTLPPAVKIDLEVGDALSAGSYSSDTISGWTARGTRYVDQGVCLYNAGATAVPTGDFALEVDSIDGDTVHGALAVTMYVLAFPGTDCGAGDTESIDVRF